MLLCDIRSLCQDEADRQHLHRLALEAHVAQGAQGKLRFCPTPDCCMVYPIDEAGGVFVSPECRRSVCAQCGQEPHTGQTCDEARVRTSTPRRRGR